MSFASVVVAASALALVGCQSSSGGDGASRGEVDTSTNDAAGQEPLAGVVRIRSVNRAPDGGVKYVIENISGQDQSDLAYFISFHYQPDVSAAIGNIRGINDRETTLERDIELLRGAAKEIAAPNPKPQGKLLGTTITVRQSPPVAAVARTGNERGSGTTFMGRALECVGMASEDEIRAGKLWIDVENIGNRPVTDLEAMAVFVDPATGVRGAETGWVQARDVAPGKTTRIQFDLAKLGRVSHLTMLVKIRQQSL